jgi:hypothetical protein
MNKIITQIAPEDDSGFAGTAIYTAPECLRGAVQSEKSEVSADDYSDVIVLTSIDT